MRRLAVAALACSGIAVGLVAEQQEYGWTELGRWLPDLAAGWTLLGAGIALLALRRPRGAVALLLLAGFSWFALNFETTGPAAVEWLAVHAAYLHRAPLLHLALAPPAGRPRTRLATRGIALAWAAAILWPLWDNDGAALVLAAIFVWIAATARASATGRRDQAIASRGLAAVALLSGAIGADGVRSIANASQGVTDISVLGYAVAVALAGGVLYTAAAFHAPALLAERAVALERGGARLRDALRDLLGDPALELGFASVDGTLVDDLGSPIRLSADGRVTTPVTMAGEQVAIVVHAPSTLDDEATRSAVLAAVGLAARRAVLRAEVERQVDAVDASRRRLLLAEEAERQHLAERLDRGPGSALAAVERLVRDARAGADEAIAGALDRASEQLARTRPELEALVHGLGGVDAGGLVPALERLTADVPGEVELRLADVTVSPEVASALWFVCSESLANAVKHAEARSLRVELAEAGGVVSLSVVDDGRGGANPGGSGLVGLSDRVTALGGRFLVDSPPGRGTRVVAELPVAEGPALAAQHG